MNVLAVMLLCLLFVVLTEAKTITEVQLNTNEERCIAQTGVPRELVIQDKTPGMPAILQSDPAFNDYLYCYLQTLRSVVVNRKAVYYPVPGYKTQYEAKSVWCKENSDPTVQCALPQDYSLKKPIRKL